MQCQFAMPVRGGVWGIQNHRDSTGNYFPTSLCATFLAGVDGKSGNRWSMMEWESYGRDEGKRRGRR